MGDRTCFKCSRLNDCNILEIMKDVEGNVLLKPYFYCTEFRPSLYYIYNDVYFNVWVENGLFYGKIPIIDYDVCFKVGSAYTFQRGCVFVIMKNGKYGLLSEKFLH